MKNLSKNIFFIFAITLFFSSTIFSQYKIHGVVTADGESLIGATIIILENKKQAVTQMNGDYLFENIASGNYNLEVNYLGYENYQVAINVQGDTPLDIEIARQVQVGELIVLATRARETTPMTYTNIKKEVLEKNNLGQDVPFLLKWSPSVVVTSDGGTGMGYTGIRVRGTDPTRINVTLNGIPLNDSESQGVYWVDLPDFSSSTEDIQIQRGVGTSTNGAGAFGASINLNTSKVHKKPYGKLSASLGSFNTSKKNIQFGSGLLNGKFTFDGRLSQLQSDGYIDRASVDLNSYFLSAAYIGDKTSVRLNTFSGHEITYQSWYGVPAQYVDNQELRTYNAAGTEQPDTPYDNQVDDYTQTHYQALVSHQLNGEWNFNGALHYTKGAGFYEQYKADEDFADYGLSNITFTNDTLTSTDLIRQKWLDNDFYGWTYALNYSPSRFDLTFGGAWNIYKGQHFGEIIWAKYASNGAKGHRYYDNDATKKDFNIFGKIDAQLVGKLFGYLDLQYRKVDYEFLGLDKSGKQLQESESLHFFNP
ncbi:MAG TPA: TonB-dependent receptor, partial [Phaeodactylibacter sp.]|nr:TonB-dependent receptor [Phaeodactylibacter sp.]